MPSETRQKVMRHIDIVGQLQPALHQPQHAPFPRRSIALISEPTCVLLTMSVESQMVTIQWHEKEEEQWELNTYVTCECLAWRGVWNAEERRRRQNVDLGQDAILGPALLWALVAICC